MIREILKWSDLDVQKKNIGLDHKPNSVELHYPQTTSKMISFSSSDNEYQTLDNDQIFLQFILLSQSLKSSHFADSEKKTEGSAPIKYC